MNPEGGPEMEYEDEDDGFIDCFVFNSGLKEFDVVIRGLRFGIL